MGTRRISGASSERVSGKYAKSIVLLSPTALRAREVLKWRVGVGEEDVGVGRV